jgi:hypothetical protein
MSDLIIPHVGDGDFETFGVGETPEILLRNPLKVSKQNPALQLSVSQIQDPHSENYNFTPTMWLQQSKIANPQRNSTQSSKSCAMNHANPLTKEYLIKYNVLSNFGAMNIKSTINTPKNHLPGSIKKNGFLKTADLHQNLEGNTSQGMFKAEIMLDKNGLFYDKKCMRWNSRDPYPKAKRMDFSDQRKTDKTNIFKPEEMKPCVTTFQKKFTFEKMRCEKRAISDPPEDPLSLFSPKDKSMKLDLRNSYVKSKIIGYNVNADIRLLKSELKKVDVGISASKNSFMVPIFPRDPKLDLSNRNSAQFSKPTTHRSYTGHMAANMNRTNDGLLNHGSQKNVFNTKTKKLIDMGSTYTGNYKTQRNVRKHAGSVRLYHDE